MRINEQPQNLDYLSPTQFKFTMLQLPQVEFFVTAANLPAITLTDTDMQTPYKVIPMMGTELTFDVFTITFIVDEEMRNYIELHNWMVSIGFPSSREQFAAHRSTTSTTPSATRGTTTPTRTPTSRTPANSMFTDATLTMLSNKNNPMVEARFLNMFPTALGELSFSQDATDIDYIKCEATFAYQIYTLHNLT